MKLLLLLLLASSSLYAQSIDPHFGKVEPIYIFEPSDTLTLRLGTVTPSQISAYMKAVYSKPDTVKCVYQAINQYGEVLWWPGYRVYPPWDIHIANPGGTEVILNNRKQHVKHYILDYRLFNWKPKAP